MIEGVQILRADTPNQLGRTYTLSALEHCVERSRQGPIPGTFGLVVSTELESGALSHLAHNLRIVDGYLVGDIEILDTPRGRILSELVDRCVFRTLGLMRVEDGKVFDFKLVAIQATTHGVML